VVRRGFQSGNLPIQRVLSIPQPQLGHGKFRHELYSVYDRTNPFHRRHLGHEIEIYQGGGYGF
jgi:hypothetical protein